MQFTAQDLASIIDTCGKAGVSRLKIGDLDIWFGRPAEPTLSSPGELHAATQAPEAEISDLLEKEARAALARDVDQMREEELSELWLTDPVLAERLRIEGEMGDDGDEHDDSDG